MQTGNKEKDRKHRTTIRTIRLPGTPRLEFLKYRNYLNVTIIHSCKLQVLQFSAEIFCNDLLGSQTAVIGPTTKGTAGQIPFW